MNRIAMWVGMALAIACAIGVTRVAEAGGKESRRAARARHAAAQRDQDPAASSTAAQRQAERNDHTAAQRRRAASAGEDMAKPATTQPAAGRPYLTPADQAFRGVRAPAW